MSPALPSLQRVLLKISGEFLAGDGTFFWDPLVLSGLAEQMRHLYQQGVRLGVVMGGGNFLRGAGLDKFFSTRAVADQMGMMATLMNGLAFRDALESQGVAVSLFSACGGEGFLPYDPHAARRALERSIVLCAGGTGNPYFSTDTAAVLRALELGCDALLKGTKVDGVYDKDPLKEADASFFPEVSYDWALERKIAIMDQTAFALARENRLPVRVFSLKNGGIVRVMRDQMPYTTIS